MPHFRCCLTRVARRRYRCSATPSVRTSTARRPRRRARGAGRVRDRPPVDLPGAGGRGRRLCARAATRSGVRKGDRVGIWAPNCAEWVFVQFATAKLGAILVNINPAYRTHELAYVLKQAGISVLLAAPTSSPATTARWSPRCSRECPQTCGKASSSATPQWDDLLERRSPRRPGARWPSMARPAHPRRPDQHPVHLGDDRLPQGRHAHPPQPAQQRVLRRRRLRVHRGRPGLHPGALLPLLRHGDGQSRLHVRTAPRW